MKTLQQALTELLDIARELAVRPDVVEAFESYDQALKLHPGQMPLTQDRNRAALIAKVLAAVAAS